MRRPKPDPNCPHCDGSGLVRKLIAVEPFQRVYSYEKCTCVGPKKASKR